jgi:hypothetical protein
MSNTTTANLNTTLFIAAATVLGVTDTETTTCQETQTFRRIVSQRVEYNSASSTLFNVRERFNLDGLHRNKRKLNTISSLGNNWNGHGASEIPAELIEIIGELINSLSIQPAIFPTGRGTVQLEYSFNEGNYMEIEVSIDGSEVYGYKNQAEFENSINNNEIFEKINEFLTIA